MSGTIEFPTPLIAAASWASLTGKPTTIAGFGITDAYTKAQGDARYELVSSLTADVQAIGDARYVQGVGAFNTLGDARYLQIANAPALSAGTFTPSITFGGGSTGMTFSNVQAQYKKIASAAGGSIVLAFWRFQFSNKGSSTGNANITLPFTADAFAVNGSSVSIGACANMTAITGMLSGWMSNTTQITFLSTGPGAPTVATQGNFNNTTDLIVSVVYAATT